MDEPREDVSCVGGQVTEGTEVTNRWTRLRTLERGRAMQRQRKITRERQN